MKKIIISMFAILILVMPCMGVLAYENETTYYYQYSIDLNGRHQYMDAHITFNTGDNNSDGYNSIKPLVITYGDKNIYCYYDLSQDKFYSTEPLYNIQYDFDCGDFHEFYYILSPSNNLNDTGITSVLAFGSYYYDDTYVSAKLYKFSCADYGLTFGVKSMCGISDDGKQLYKTFGNSRELTRNNIKVIRSDIAVYDESGNVIYEPPNSQNDNMKCHLDIEFNNNLTQNDDSVYMVNDEDKETLDFTVTSNYDGFCYCSVYENINNHTFGYYPLTCSSGNEVNIYRYMVYHNLPKFSGEQFASGYYHAIPISKGVPLDISIPKVALNCAKGQTYAICFASNNDHDLQSDHMREDGTRILFDYPNLWVNSSVGGFMQGQYDITFAYNNEYNPYDVIGGNGIDDNFRSGETDENNQYLVNNIKDFNIISAMDTIQNVGVQCTSFFMIIAHMCSFVPTSIWSLIGVMITVLIILRVAGR